MEVVLRTPVHVDIVKEYVVILNDKSKVLIGINMKVIYDDKVKVFIVINEEIETFINTNNIVEARKIYLERMEWLLNDAVRERLKY